MVPERFISLTRCHDFALACWLMACNVLLLAIQVNEGYPDSLRFVEGDTTETAIRFPSLAVVIEFGVQVFLMSHLTYISGVDFGPFSVNLQERKRLKAA